MPTSDVELLQAWKAGDSAAGGALFERHFDAVARFFRNKVDGSIDDLVQKTFLGCVEGREGVRGDSGFRPYLFGVARNVLHNHWRGRVSGLRQVEFEDASVVQLGGSPSSAFARDQGQLTMLNALRRIPLEAQVVLELCYWEQMTGVEVAAVLEIPVGTAKTRIRRARQLLQARLVDLAARRVPLHTTQTRLETWARGVRPAATPSGPGK